MLRETVQDVHTGLLSLLLTLLLLIVRRLSLPLHLFLLLVLKLAVLLIFRREECLQPLVLCLLLVKHSIEIHDLIFKFPNIEFNLIVLLLGAVDLRSHLLLALHGGRITC